MFTESSTVRHPLNPGTTTMIDVNTNSPHGGGGGGADSGVSGMIALQQRPTDIL